jgi:AcrR family transcriptional regulator
VVRVKGRQKTPSFRKVQRVRPRPLDQEKPASKRAGGARLFNITNTKSFMIQHARALFAKNGFDGVSVKDVAQATKLNVSLVSYHFNGKEGLYEACLEGFGIECLESVQRTLTSPSTYEECIVRLEMFIDLMLDIFIKEPDASAMVFKEADMEARTISRVFQSTFVELFNTIVIFFEDSKKLGFVDSDIDPHTLASICFGALSHFARMDAISTRYFNRSLKDSKHRHRVASHLKATFLPLFKKVT